MVTKIKQAEQAEAAEKLREWLKPGDTVRTILRHVSKSGMTRDISTIITLDGDPWDATYMVARALGERIENGGVRVGGCGMDMGFDLVYRLSLTLFHDYQCIGDRCPSNNHVNSPQPARDGKMQHHDGYALNQRWL